MTHNHYINKLFMAAIIAIIAIAGIEAKAQPYSSKTMNIDSLIARMTLEEKIGQLNLINGFGDATGPEHLTGDAALKYNMLKTGQVGAMLNIMDAQEAKTLQEIAVKQSRLGIPLLFGFDVIHGFKTIFPIPLGEAASWDLKAVEKSARISAIEATSAGINWTFAPMVDITRDARWGRIMEGSGEDPYLGALMGAARVKGFQGDNLADRHTLAACVKHFAAYGFAESGRDYNTVDISRSTLYNFVLPPFKATIDAGVRTVMNSFNIFEGVPATGNSFLQCDILKGDWAFDGFVVSDWASVAEMIPHDYATDLKDAAQKALTAGSDMDMESYAYVNHLKELVETGKIDIKHINDAVRRILLVKQELGLFDNPYLYCSDDAEKTKLYAAEHAEAALDVAKRSFVLLKNEKSLLPLPKKDKKIAVIGSLAADKNSPLGSWRIASDDNTAVSLMEGLANYPDNKYNYQKGLDYFVGEATFRTEVVVNTTDKTGLKQAVKAAAASDVVVMVVGEHGFHSGEGRSRTEITLPGLQQEMLEEVYKVNKNIVLVVMSGRPLVLNWAAEHIPAILQVWQPGSQAGNAIAQVLMGDYNPSGKLPVTFPRSVGQVPLYYNHMSTGRPQPQSSTDVFWSHYSDELNTPLYPFGFGLSYTTFAYSNLKVTKKGESMVEVSVDVKNNGNVDGEEVVQLYLRQPAGVAARPVKELKGFEKIMLKQGQTTTVSFTLTQQELGFYLNNGSFIVQPGKYKVMVGGNSSETMNSEFEL